MFSFRSKAAQANKNSGAAPKSEFKWHRSYNWLLIILPLIGGGVYLSYQDTLMPIRTIQLSGTFRASE